MYNYNFDEIDIEGFGTDDFDEDFEMRESYGVLYVGHIAFDFVKTCELDRFIEVSVLLTEEEGENETFGEVEYIDTVDDVNMVSILDIIILDEDLSLETIKANIDNFIRNFDKYDISSKLDEETLSFYYI